MVSLEGFKQMSSIIRLVWFSVFFFQTGFFFFFKVVQRMDFREFGTTVAHSEREGDGGVRGRRGLTREQL